MIKSTINPTLLWTALVASSFLLPAGADAQPRNAPRLALLRDRSNQRDWTLHVEVRIRPQRPIATRELIPDSTFTLSGFKFYYPLIPGTSMSVAYPDRLESKFGFGAQPVRAVPTVTVGYQGPCSLASWTMGPVKSNEVIFTSDLQMTCYETRIDEAAARRYPWPTAPWSNDLALCLQPQLFVESDQPIIKDLAAKWAGGDPKKLAPYDLAKKLAAGAILHFNPTEPITISPVRLRNLPTDHHVIAVSGFITGFNVHGAAHAATRRNGSPYDLACMLTAAYRAAGIPARLVIGYDIQESEKYSAPVLRAWTEFFLARDPVPPASTAPRAPTDPPLAITIADGEWIPVDITRQREFSSRPQALNQRWQFFGHNEEFDFVAPIAFHWLPPERCASTGAPGLWGWQPTPGNPVADSELKFWAQESENRGGNRHPR